MVQAGCSGPLIVDSDSMPAAAPPSSPGAPVLRPRESPIAVGDTIPPFLLMDQAGVGVSAAELSAAKGSVLVFVPRDDSPGSRPAYEWARRHKGFLSQQGIEMVLATPGSGDANARIASREELRLAVLSDPGSRLARAFGIGGDGPWTFVLGKNGRIQLATPGLPAVEQVVMAAETLPGKEKDGFFSPF